MSVLELQSDVVYGPIQSRRLGRSLGINLLPTTHKLCTFDCIYCQYGSAQMGSLAEREMGFPSVDDVLRSIEAALRQQPAPDYLTFSGNGEPTLHPHFPQIVAEVQRARDTVCPDTRLAILSNSSRVAHPDVRRALEQLDDPIMKLDVGDPETLARVNRPAAGVTFEEIVAGLQAMPRLIVQTMIITGPVQNVEGEAHEAWIRTLARLAPERVQIYSTERPVAETGVRRVSKDKLERLARNAEQRTGISVTAY